MAPFDRPYTTFYWSAIVNMALSCTIFELFDIDLDFKVTILFRGHSRSFIPVPFESLGAVFYSPSIVIMALSCTYSKIHQTLVKNCDFFIPPLHSTPQLWGSPSEYCHPVWYRKTRMVGLPEGEKL